MYWIYWGVLFATPLTWLFTISATVNEEWIVDENDDENFGGFADGRFAEDQCKDPGNCPLCK